MSYKCLECGHIFENGEAREVREDDGYVYVCPICGGDFEKTVKCSLCKGEFLEDELNGGVCDECIDEYRNQAKICVDISEQEGTKAKINVNYLIPFILSEEDINDILIEYIEKEKPNADCGAYIDEDISWFGEMLAKEVKNNENSKKKS